MNNLDFIRAGRALYGNNWKASLSRDLGVSEKTVGRWARGERIPADDVEQKVGRLLLARVSSISMLLMNYEKLTV